MPPFKRKFVPSKEIIKKVEVKDDDKNGNPSSEVCLQLPCVLINSGYVFKIPFETLQEDDEDWLSEVKNDSGDSTDEENDPDLEGSDQENDPGPVFVSDDETENEDEGSPDEDEDDEDVEETEEEGSDDDEEEESNNDEKQEDGDDSENSSENNSDMDKPLSGQNQGNGRKLNNINMS